MPQYLLSQQPTFCSWSNSGICGCRDLRREAPLYPVIQDLYLRGVQLPLSLEVIPRPTFQNLVKFNGHPSYIVWLFRSAKLDKIAVPGLERVGSSSKNYKSDTGFSGYKYTIHGAIINLV